MAEGKKTYPMLPVQVWWTLRDQFQKTIPGSVSRGYLATVLSVSERTAGNLLSPLRALGLIDDDGKPTDRANHWRFDEDYRKVCDAMLVEAYPDELRQAIPSPGANREGTIRWFMRNAGVGEAGARKMAATYELVAESTPGSKPVQPSQRVTSKSSRSARGPQDPPAIAGKENRQAPKPESVSPPPPAIQAQRSEGPSLHIDVQVHIAADASAEQIDQIFASMAKHLYNRE